MQNAKDSFYLVLRNRLAIVNSARIMTLRGVERPGILVEEAESPMAQLPNDVFVLRWVSAAYDDQLPLILVRLTCEVRYATSGSAINSGLDRGRSLAEMDEELLAMTIPTSTPKLNYATTPAQGMETMVFWSAPQLGALKTLRDSVARSAEITVFAFEEQGDK